MSVAYAGGVQAINPAYNQNIHYFESTRRNEEGFKFVVDINSGTTNICRLRYFPRPNDGLGEFDVRGIIKNKVSTYISNTLNSVAINENNIFRYTFDVGEEYVKYWAFTGMYASTANTLSISASTDTHPYLVGEQITIAADTGFTIYDGLATITSVADNKTITTNIPFTSASAVTGTTVYFDHRKTYYPSYSAGDAFRVFKGAIPQREFMSYDYEEYYLKIFSTTNKMLTTVSDYYPVKMTNKMYLNSLVSPTLIGSRNIGYTIKTKFGWYTDIFPTGSTLDPVSFIGACGPYNIENNTNFTPDDGANFVNSTLPVLKNKTLNVLLIETAGTGPIYNSINLTIASGHSFAEGEFVDIKNATLVVDGITNIIGTGATTIEISLPFILLSPVSFIPTNCTVNQIVDEYSVSIYGIDDGESFTKEYNFVLDKTCQKFENIQLLFVDRMSSMIPVNFELQSYKTINITRSQFRKDYGTYTKDDGFYYDSFERGNTQFNVVEVEQLVLNTNWLREVDAAFLRELFTSPEVYIVENDKLYPVILKTDSLAIFTKNNKSNIQYQLTIEYANNNPING